MSVPPPCHESFKRRLRLAIDEAGLTVYGLARLMADQSEELAKTRPQDRLVVRARLAEQAERKLYRWLSPVASHLPSRASRRALAVALERDEDFFDPKPGVDEMVEIARAHAGVELREELLRRRVWCAPGGPYGGWYLTAAQRELIQAC